MAGVFYFCITAIDYDIKTLNRVSKGLSGGFAKHSGRAKMQILIKTEM